MGSDSSKQDEKPRSDGPSTLGGHVSHIGGLKLIFLIIIGYLIWKLLIK